MKTIYGFLLMLIISTAIINADSGSGIITAILVPPPWGGDNFYIKVNNNKYFVNTTAPIDKAKVAFLLQAYTNQTSISFTYNPAVPATDTYGAHILEQVNTTGW